MLDSQIRIFQKRKIIENATKVEYFTGRISELFLNHIFNSQSVN